MEMRLPKRCKMFAICTICGWEKVNKSKRNSFSNGTHSLGMMVQPKTHNYQACEHSSKVQKWIMHNKCTIIGAHYKFINYTWKVYWLNQLIFHECHVAHFILFASSKRTTDAPLLLTQVWYHMYHVYTHEQKGFPFQVFLCKQGFSC